MSRPEATDMLQKGLSAYQISNAQSIESLLDFLTDLPLAIKQASAYMIKTGMVVSKYLDYCRSSDEHLIELLSKDFNDRARYKSIQNPVAATWLISFEAISRDNPLAAKYLQFMAFLAEKDIPRHLLPPTDDELGACEAIGMLKAYAFITERADGNTIKYTTRILFYQISFLIHICEVYGLKIPCIQVLRKQWASIPVF
jgi:hypothetical protein